jgi:hypothetical protein
VETHYLIDYENAGKNGFKGCEKLTSSDFIHLFYTDNSKNNIRAAYGAQTLKVLSKSLTKEFGKGFSRSNLQNMRAFYLNYPEFLKC